MKGKIKLLFMLGVMLVMFVCLGISASAYEIYEPDGTSSTVYKYDSSECNRSLIIRCYDTSGNHLKTVNYRTKRGEDTIICLRIYDYDITAFESDQGLWETCKLQYTSGGGFAYSDIDINYYFRTALSAETLNVTVTMRKMEGTICVERLFFFTSRKRGISCFGIGIVRIEDCVFGISVIRPNTPFSSFP